MMKQSRYIDEVNRLLARLDGYHQENTEPEPEPPIPDTQEPIQDMYIRYVFIDQAADQDEGDIIDSTLTEPDTTVPYAPELATQPLTQTQAQDEKKSLHVGLFMMSLLLF